MKQFKPTREIKLWVICLGLAWLLAACTGKADSWERIQAAGRLRVGLDPTYPPFELADAVPLQGLDVDLARAIGADLGLTVEFVYFGYDGLYDALTTAQADVLISALVIMPERLEDFAYSDPYFNAGQVLITRQGGTTFGEMVNMNGRILAVELGTPGHVTASEWARRMSNLTVQPYNTPDEALTAVATATADAALVDMVSGRLYLKNHPASRLQRGETAVTDEPYALVVLAKEQRLLTALNASLSRLETSGQLDTIINNWLGK